MEGAWRGLCFLQAAETPGEKGFVEVMITSEDHAPYFLNPRPVYISVIFYWNTGRILGDQLAGFESVARWTDIFVTSIFRE